jgi:hypothetical protein
VRSTARRGWIAHFHPLGFQKRHANELRKVVEQMHDGSARLVQSVPVQETFEGKTVLEGVVHVFDLAGHPTATRAYAWSSPIEGSTKRRFFAVLRRSSGDAR